MQKKVTTLRLLQIKSMIIFAILAFSFDSLLGGEATFKSSFTGTVQIDQPFDRRIIGTDSITNHTWPNNLPGDNANHMFNFLVNDTANLNKYVETRIDDVIGMDGKQTKALYAEYKTNDPSTYAQSRVQYNVYADYNAPNKIDRLDELYIKYKMKMTLDMVQPTFWRNMMEWGTLGDEYRMVIYISRINGGAPFWRLNTEYINTAGIPRSYWWEEQNHDVPVPLNEWFDLEVYWNHSTGDDGVVWVKVNGEKILEHLGPNKVTKAWQYWTPFKVYGVEGKSWYTDVEIWDHIPSDAELTTPSNAEATPSGSFIIMPGILK